MAQVVQPQKKDAMGKILPIAGAVVGGVTGGPSGAMTGYQAGQMGSNILGSNNQQSPGVQAAQRRIQAPEPMAAPSPLQDLEAARMEVAQLPPEQRQQFEAPILAALMKARREGMA